MLHNFNRERSLLKLLIKKLSPKINVKNIKIDLVGTGQLAIVHVYTNESENK